MRGRGGERDGPSLLPLLLWARVWRSQFIFAPRLRRHCHAASSCCPRSPLATRCSPRRFFSSPRLLLLLPPRRASLSLLWFCRHLLREVLPRGKGSMQVACQKDAAPEGQNLGGRKQEGQEIPRLPTSTKICYALGGAPYQLTGNVISFFLQIFLLDVVQLDAFWTSSVIFVGRAWDSISDPIIGYLVSKSPLRKCGKLIPWTLGSTPFGVLMYCLLWYTPSDDLPNSWKFFWYLTTYCFFQTCLSCYHVPYTSMTMFLGGSQSDRDSVTAYRMAIEILSTLIGSGLQGLIVGKHQAKIISNCQGLNGSLSNETVSNYTFPSTETLKNARASYMIAALVISSLYCFSCAILVLGVQEQHGESIRKVWPWPAGRATWETGPVQTPIYSQSVHHHEPQNLHDPSKWIPLYLHGIPDGPGDLRLLLRPCRWSLGVLPVSVAHPTGGSLLHHSILAMVPGEVWKENYNFCWIFTHLPRLHYFCPSDKQLPHLCFHHGPDGLQHSRAFLVAMVHAPRHYR
ncbi:uncharacterized protein LOC127550487 isoform X2 [Antechinus flavipes]|uniref:uncharacterized protein LOC127550487 isoform X2 n=1 Tax=Antechinus flavipes TaxID=38775 RepID=UPI0022368484|nr:uncharacterized protein LOC127550487 isoform X2 [Antechinus flavipes]